MPSTAAAAKPPQPVNDVVTVERPTVGRVVLVNIGGYDQDEPRLRPGVVLARGDAPDAVNVAMFLDHSDHPLPPGVAVRQAVVGTSSYPQYTTWVRHECRYGSGPGQWTWPTRLDEPETFEVIVPA